MIRPAGDFFRISFASVRHLQQGSAVAQRPFAGPLDHGSVGHGVAERNTQFNHIRAGFDRGKSDVPRGREIGVAASEIGDQRRAVLES